MTATTRKNITIDDIREALAGDGESEPLNPLNTNAHAIPSALTRIDPLLLKKLTHLH